jgi:trimeric autotransporter adhesin
MKIITGITYPGFGLFAFACFALASQGRADCQEGCLTNQNIVLGDNALISLTTGSNNTAIGSSTLSNNTSGFNNIAIGVEALLENTTGFSNTATGSFALDSNTNGFFNTANGTAALYNNTTGQSNTAMGVDALYSNTTGHKNTANGWGALVSNTSGNYNTALGFWALSANTIGNGNTANGFESLIYNTTGSNNTAEGFQALGKNATGSNNIALGNKAGSNLTTGDGNIDIGNPGLMGESNTIRIGDPASQRTTFIAGISGSTIPGGLAVIVDANGHLGTTTSSARFKEAIKPMDKASEAILALRPVTFRYKKELDPDAIPQFGLVAEDVAKVNRDLVVRDADGKAYTVRYDAVNTMLLNEFLKEHRKVEELEATVEQLAAAVKEQASQIQKVSARLEASKSSPQIVLNNQ